MGDGGTWSDEQPRQPHPPNQTSTDDIILRRRDLDDLNIVLAQASACSSELCSLKELQETHFAALAGDVENERNERQQQYEELTGKLLAVVSESQQIQAEQQRLDCLLHKAETAGDSLITASVEDCANPMVLKGRRSPVQSTGLMPRARASKSPNYNYPSRQGSVPAAHDLRSQGDRRALDMRFG